MGKYGRDRTAIACQARPGRRLLASTNMGELTIEKAERLQTEIMSAGGTKQKKDHQAAKARREVEAVKLATQSIQAQQALLADFQEGMLEVNPEDITNPMGKNFRSTNLEDTKRHLLTKLLEGKPTSMVEALLANQDTAERPGGKQTAAGRRDGNHGHQQGDRRRDGGLAKGHPTHGRTGVL